jgi:hypothetical protein
MLLSVLYSPIATSKFGTVESSSVMGSIVLISSELHITEMPYLADSIPEQYGREYTPGSKYPRAVVVWAMVPTPSVKVEVAIPGIKQVVRHSNCNIHAEFRRIDELR